MLGSVLLLAFAAGWLAALVLWTLAIIYALKVVRNVQPGVSVWSKRLGYNPANVIFHPELLTVEGVKYRRRLGRVLLAFALAILGTLVLGAVSGVPTS